MNMFKKNKTKDWGDVKLYQLQEIDSLPEFDSKLDMMIEQLSILKNVDPYDIKKMPIDDMVKEFEEWAFISNMPQPKKNDLIKIDGNKYGFIELDKMSLGQMVDIEEYVADGLMKNLHKILSVLYLPIKKYNPISKKYELEPYEPNKEREDMFLSMGLDKLYPTVVFFYHIVQTFLKGFQISSMETMENILKENKGMMSKEEEQYLMQRLKLMKELGEHGIG